MSIDIWLKIAVKLRVRNKNRLIVESPILVRANRDRVEPITWAYKLRMDRVYAPNLIGLRHPYIVDGAVRRGIHMARSTNYHAHVIT